VLFLVPFAWPYVEAAAAVGLEHGQYGPIENNQNVDSSELHNAAVEPICRALELRYRLLPHSYTIAREACDTGLR
jgi:alpha-glucosidase (family GH31 glycosyl hydrolase)